MGVSAAITTAIQPIDQGVDSLAGQIGNIANQVLGYVKTAQTATTTPIAITLPTATQSASIGLAPSALLEYGIFAFIGFLILRKVL